MDAAALVEILDEAFWGPSWHGPGLWQALKKVPFEEALSPVPGSDTTVWGLVLHCAYWKYKMRLQLLKAGKQTLRLPFSRTPVDFPALPKVLDKKSWADDKKLLCSEHEMLKLTVGGFPADLWSQFPADADKPYWRQVLGSSYHDTFHTAQIWRGRKKF